MNFDSQRKLMRIRESGKTRRGKTPAAIRMLREDQAKYKRQMREWAKDIRVAERRREL